MAQTLLSLKVDALHDYWAFLDLIKFRGGTKAFSAIHKELSEFLTIPQRLESFTGENDPRRRLILMPRGHLKSTLCSVGYVLWRIYRNPNIRVVVGTADKKLSLAFVGELKQYLEDEELQERVWNNRPHLKGRLIPLMDTAAKKRRDRKLEMEEFTEAQDKKIVWRGDAIQVLRPDIMKEPTVLAASVGTVITGLHFDIGILDDIVTFKNTTTPVLMEKTLTWVRDLDSIIDPAKEVTIGTGKNAVTEWVGDEAVVLGTRYAKGDYYGYLLHEVDATEEFGDDTDQYMLFSRNIYVNGTDDSDGYIWPERFNANVIAKIKARLRSPKKFASQYLNRILADEDTVLRKEHIQYIHSTAIEIQTNITLIRFKDLVTPVVVRPVLVVDPAISQAKKADNTCLMVGGLDHERNLYILDCKVGKFTPNQTVQHILDLTEKWKLHSVTIENVGFQASLNYSLRDAMRAKNRTIVIREWRPQHMGKKVERITAALEPIFTNHKIHMMTWLAQVPQLMEEIEFFGASGIKDDTLDAMSIVVETAVATPERKPRVVAKVWNSKYGGRR